MKVAICLSGHTRTFEKTCASHANYLLDKYNPDVFIHTYNTTGFKINGNESNESQMLETESLKRVIDFYHPKYIMCEDNDEIIERSCPNAYLTPSKKAPETSVKSVLSMFYSIKKSNDLKSKCEKNYDIKYDAVIRLRFDDMINQLDYDLSNVEEGKVYAPSVDGLNMNARFNGGWSWRGGMNDQLFFGSSKTMDICTRVYDQIPNFYHNNVCIFHPETMLKTQMLRHKLQPELIDEIKFDLLR